MSHTLFVYGTLRHPEVRRAVLKEDVPASHCIQAFLAGHAVMAVAGTHYPLIEARPKQADIEDVEGLILTGLTDAQIDALDRFEGADYRRFEVQVVLADGTHRQSDIYRTINPLKTDGPWVYDKWLAAGGLEAFLADELDPDGVKRPE